MSVFRIKVEGVEKQHFVSKVTGTLHVDPADL